MEDIFEVIVIGGGITGAGILRDLSTRKIKSLLIEKGDFASGTSSKSGKLIHGGLRYLRYGHIKTVWESCQERIRLYTILAPHLTRPVIFISLFIVIQKRLLRWQQWAFFSMTSCQAFAISADSNESAPMIYLPGPASSPSKVLSVPSPIGIAFA